uniref:probable NADH dehydrogenase [ubiquinone] 1 alpha subcomplex subunit 5, mitochondrial n=1 Tax=Erigeron canadensis TaxID=72917 RepID=UPI001CB8FA71|nr:probable NADH dehydrogenase [ubiquinone] 1 alpha subcomplex subunit 5, mitochondrial [Erigeron canadensis]
MFLRKFARPSMMMRMRMNPAVAAAAKETSTTGPVAEATKSKISRPVQELIYLYERTIKEVQSIPEDEGYRKALEANTRQRLDICVREDYDPQAIEKRIGCQEFDDLLRDARFEFKILSNLLEWDPWGINPDYISDVIDKLDQPPKVNLGSIPEELYERLRDLAKASCEEDKYNPKYNSSFCRNCLETSYSDEPIEGTSSSDNNSHSDKPDGTSSEPDDSHSDEPDGMSSSDDNSHSDEPERMSSSGDNSHNDEPEGMPSSDNKP